MHGLVFAELKKFVITGLGADAWNRLVAATGNADRVYLPSQVYKDEELMKLVATASEVTGKPAGELVEGFGEFMVPGLVRTYGAHINPAWRTLELLENTEETMHRVVRVSSPGAEPPQLSVKRTGPREVVIEYGSSRRLCALAKGIVRGIAKHYTESVTIDETACMLLKAPTCRIRVALA